ncbi:MAG: hypothetical protein JSS81_25735 [Acidobacteria bacterium]|nr:hypothetical protein [Acidobacteriota bacterium]
MKITRRDFFKAGGASAIGLGLFLAATGEIDGQKILVGSGGTNEILSSLTPDLMAKYIGRDFTFYSDQVVYQGSLIEVIVPQIKKPKRTFLGKTRPISGFNLRFRVQSPALGQDCYQIFEPTLGQFELLLVPGGGTNQESDMIATFSRI